MQSTSGHIMFHENSCLSFRCLSVAAHQTIEQALKTTVLIVVIDVKWLWRQYFFIFSLSGIFNSTVWSGLFLTRRIWIAWWLSWCFIFIFIVWDRFNKEEIREDSPLLILRLWKIASIIYSIIYFCIATLGNHHSTESSFQKCQWFFMSFFSFRISCQVQRDFDSNQNICGQYFVKGLVLSESKSD